MVTALGKSHDNFLDHPLVHAYVSLRAFGNLTKHLDAVLGEVRTRTSPGARILSLGCGDGIDELAMAKAFPDRAFEGVDREPAQLEAARAAADSQRVDNLLFRCEDIEEIALDRGSFDIVIGRNVIHHIKNLEHLWSEIRSALRPSGAVLVQDYVGPDRFQWTDEQVEWCNRTLADLVPEHHKSHHDHVSPALTSKLLAQDSSQAIRSSEIIPTCIAAGFSLQGQAQSGGALLQPVLMGQWQTFDPANWEHNWILSTLFREEARLMAEERLGSDFAMFVAVPTGS